MSRYRRPPDALRDNAFAVLGVDPQASRREIESTSQRLIAQLELGVASAQNFTCPATGETRLRDVELLRESLRRLREPRMRAREELYWIVASKWRQA
jgi:hypothetical protein